MRCLKKPVFTWFARGIHIPGANPDDEEFGLKNGVNTQVL